MREESFRRSHGAVSSKQRARCVAEKKPGGGSPTAVCCISTYRRKFSSAKNLDPSDEGRDESESLPPRDASVRGDRVGRFSIRANNAIERSYSKPSWTVKPRSKRPRGGSRHPEASVPKSVHS